VRLISELRATEAAGAPDWAVPGGFFVPPRIGTITSLELLHEAWRAKLSNPQWRILDALIEVYPDSLARAELAEVAGQSPNSSGYANNLGALRSLGLLDYPSPGVIVATDLLFPALRASGEPQ
jgi:hypothetical protein